MRQRLAGILVFGIIAIVASVVFARKPFDSVKDPRPYLPPEKFDLSIEVDAETYGPGEKPVLSATLHNGTREDIYVMKPLDGSRRGRAPMIKVDVEMPEGLRAPELIWFCGFQNPIVPGDLMTIPAGKSRRLGGYYIPEVAAGPGAYKVQMTYASGGISAGHIAQGIDRNDRPEEWSPKTIAKILRRTPRFVVHSNIVEVNVDWSKDDLASLLNTDDFSQSSFALDYVSKDGFSDSEIDVLVDFYLKNFFASGRDNWYSFMLTATEILAEHASEEDAGRIWNRFAFPDIPNYRPGAQCRGLIGTDFIKLLLRLPQTEREVAIRTTLGGDEKHKRFAQPDEDMVTLLFADDSPARTETLVSLYRLSKHFDKTRDSLARELARRGVDVSGVPLANAAAVVR